MNAIRAFVNPYISEYKARDFALSPFIGRNILYTRILLFAFAILTFIIDASTSGALFYYEFFYLTNLSYIGVIIYLLSALIITIRFQSDTFDSLDRAPRLLKWIHWNLYIIQIVYQPIVVLVFWTILSRDVATYSSPQRFFNLTKHGRCFIDVIGVGLMLVCMYIDFLFNAIRIYFSQWVAPIVVGLLYIAWGETQHVIVPGFYAYFFLDPSKPYSAGFITVVFVLLIVVFVLVVGLHRLRDFTLDKIGVGRARMETVYPENIPVPDWPIVNASEMQQQP